MGYGSYPIAPGGAGTPGADGENAYVELTSPFDIITANSGEDVYVVVTGLAIDWIQIGQPICIGNGTISRTYTAAALGLVDLGDGPVLVLTLNNDMNDGASGQNMGTALKLSPGGKKGPTGATGAAGSANISGTANKLVKFTGTTSGGDSRVTDDGSAVTVVADPGAGKGLIVQVDGVAATAGGGGIEATNTTSTTSPAASVQRSPPLRLKARARVSGTDTGFVFDAQFIPTTGGNWQLLLRKSTDGGSTFAEIGRLTNATPTQFVQAFYNVSGFSAGDGSIGFFFETDLTGMFRGGSGDLQLFARAAGLPMLLRSPTTTSGQASFRLYANGATRGATETLVEIGDVAAGFTLRFRVMGDGVAENPRLHTDATVHTAGTFTGALYTFHKVDLSGSAVTVTLPAATDANAGAEILIAQTVAGAGTLNLTPSSGNIEGTTTIARMGSALAPYLTIRLVSLGATFGWKVG